MRRIPAVIAAALLVGAVVQCSVNDRQRISLNPGPPIGISVVEGAYRADPARLPTAPVPAVPACVASAIVLPCQVNGRVFRVEMAPRTHHQRTR